MNTISYLVILWSYLLFLMQLGYAMHCAGSVRAKNLILANVVAMAGGLFFYLFGFPFAFGDGSSSVTLFSLVRNNNNTIDDDEYSYDYVSFFLLQWAFAITAAGITSGSVPMTTRFGSHLVISFSISGVVYPVVARWVWSSDGWLSPSSTELLFGSGAIDFGGGGLVSLVGGIAGMLGSMIGGRRGVMDPFRKYSRKALPRVGDRAMMVVLGLLLLWFGWFWFNPDYWFSKVFEAYASTTNQGTTWIILSRTAAVVAVASLIAGVVTVLGQRFVVGHWDELDACIGVIGGVVAISSGCSVVEPWAAVVCGVLAACLLVGLNVLALKLHFNDTLEATQLYGGCGAWGLVFTGLFAKKELVIQAYNHSGDSSVSRPFGLLMGGGWGLLGAQVIELLVIVGWVSVTTGPLFYFLHKLRILGTSVDDEITSLDYDSYCGGCAYIQSRENHVRYYGDYTRMQDEQC
ncbi:Ammonium transporter [Trema orientale]|uniref:Ammonium transporter n=1 Tax=Trema orientale TaxID=63057 RepID=A0A2P5FJW2_TREOI|nr:Ammonium transporter [Trema orientale]